MLTRRIHISKRFCLTNWTTLLHQFLFAKILVLLQFAIQCESDIGKLKAQKQGECRNSNNFLPKDVPFDKERSPEQFDGGVVEDMVILREKAHRHISILTNYDITSQNCLQQLLKSTNNNRMRKLKHHEKKLLKKVNFYDWKIQSDKRQSRVIHRYHLQKRQDYTHYNKICGMITSMICKIKLLQPDDPFRIKATEQILQKLYNMGIINSRQNIQIAQKISVSSFCRRRLAVLLCALKFSQTLKESITFVEQGHVRIGTETVTEPSFLVTRQLEDHVGWVDTSSIKQKILKYNDKFDDYDQMN